MTQPEERGLIDALVGLVRCIDTTVPEGQTLALIRSGILLLDGTEQARRTMADRLHSEKARLVPDCAVCPHPCGRHDDGDWGQVEGGDPEVLAAKSALLARVRQLARQPDSDDMTLCLLLFQLGEELDADALRQYI